MTEKKQCNALTKKGLQCKNKATSGSDYCRGHRVKSDLSKQRLEIQTELQSLVRDLNSFTSTLEKNITQHRLNIRPAKQVWQDVRTRIDETATGELFDRDTWQGVSEFVRASVEVKAEEFSNRFKRDD